MIPKVSLSSFENNLTLLVTYVRPKVNLTIKVWHWQK